MRILGIVCMLLVAIFAATQPYLGVYAGADPAFLHWLSSMGAIIFFHSVLLFAVYILRKASDREVSAVSLLFMLIYFFMFYKLRQNPEIVPIPTLEGEKFVLWKDAEFKDDFVRIMLSSILVIMVLSILHYIKATFFPSTASST